MCCEQLQQQRATRQKVRDLFHAVAFEVLKKFSVPQPYSFFSLEEEREAIKCRREWAFFL